MQFTRDDSSSLTIRSVERGAIEIGEQVINASVALTADRIIDGWCETQIENLTVENLKPLLDENPELIVLGTGWQSCLPPRELMFALAKRGVGLEMMDTPAACRTFNILIAEGRRPAAVLLLD